MIRKLTITCSLALLAACGGGGGSSAPAAPVPDYEERTVAIAGTGGFFEGKEKTQTIRIYTGARAGQVQFRSDALNMTITGKAGDEIWSTDGKRFFYIVYDPNPRVNRVGLRNKWDVLEWSLTATTAVVRGAG